MGKLYLKIKPCVMKRLLSSKQKNGLGLKPGITLLMIYVETVLLSPLVRPGHRTMNTLFLHRTQCSPRLRSKHAEDWQSAI